jgi:23S rRNA pseudouridine2605 synthase
MEQRLQKLLAAAGVASRREAEKLITSGRVSVDGVVVTELGAKADPDTASITVDGKPIDLHPRKVYVLLNKPRGYASTRRDPHAPRVVTDLVKDAADSLYPVGRLDVDTEGLLILTNDGDFTLKMTHPRHKVPKTYRAEVRGLVPEETLLYLSHGVRLEDGMTFPAEIKPAVLNTARETSVVDITIREGRKRQVRRMFEAVGHPVIKLARVSFGNLKLANLRPGEWRFLTQQEVEGLLALAC